MITPLRTRQQKRVEAPETAPPKKIIGIKDETTTEPYRATTVAELKMT